MVCYLIVYTFHFLSDINSCPLLAASIEDLQSSISDEKIPPPPLKPGEKRFEVKSWDAIAMWSWDSCSTICMICRNQIMDICIECQANCDELNFGNCPIVWGTCGHAYHDHCINRFLRIRNVCPLDNQEWKCSRYGR